MAHNCQRKTQGHVTPKKVTIKKPNSQWKIHVSLSCAHGLSNMAEITDEVDLFDVAKHFDEDSN